MHTAKSHIEKSQATLTQSVIAARAFSRGLSKCNQRHRSLSVNCANGNSASATFTFPNFFLREGTNLVTATATDGNGQIGTASLTLYVDQTAPILTIEAPVNTGLAGLAMPFGKSNNNPATTSATGTATIPSALTSNAQIDVRGIVNDAVEGGLKVPYPTVTVANITTGLTTPGKVSDRYFIVEDVPLDVGQNELTVTATDWVGNARSQKLIVSRVNVGSNRITLAGGNRQRGALNTELTKPLIVTAIDKTGLPLANIALTFEVLRGTGSINPATTSSTTTTTGTGSNTVTTTIPNALTGANLPPTKPNGVNPARRLLIITDANGRAAVWFTLGKQSGEAGNMVQVSGSDSNATNSSNANLANATSDAISESVLFTATGDRGVPAKILAEGGGAQYAETGGQPLDPLTAVTYDGEVNAVPGAVIAYVIEQDGGVDLDDGAKFTNSSASNALAISNNRKVLITSADNNGRSAARPTMGTATGTVRISTYAMPPNTAVTTALVEGLASGTALTTTSGLVGLATFQIAVLQQSDGPTQFTGKILDHTGKPLQGVRVTISRTPLSVTTDTAGNFTFMQDVPQGKLDLFVDGRAVTGTTPLPGGQTSPTQYPSLHFEVLAIRGQKNILPHPIYLPPILMSQAKIVGGNEDVSLTIPGRDGFEMIVKANSVTFPDGTRIGPLVVSPVADDRLPMSPPGGGSSFMPGAAATLQPSGTRFDPPIEVRLPNASGYAPGERVPVYHWDHDIGQFVAMGQATVTDDGAQLITDPGSGITKAGWHGPPTPPPCVDTGTTGTCAECQKVESVGGGGGRCPAVKICMKDYESAARCDDKDECTANDKCENGACKGQAITVTVAAQTNTLCKDTSRTFVATTTPPGRVVLWTSSSDAASVVDGAVTGVRSGLAVIRAVDASCGKAVAEFTVRVLYPRVDYDGSNEADYFVAHADELPNPVYSVAAIKALGELAYAYPRFQFEGLYQVPNGTGGVKSSCYEGLGTEGTEWDALRHIYGACQLHRWSGAPPGWMDGFLNAHENKDPGINADGSDNPLSCKSSEMDQNNNLLGKRLARQPGECGELAKEAINSGAAQINRPYDPTVCRKLF